MQVFAGLAPLVTVKKNSRERTWKVRWLARSPCCLLSVSLSPLTLSSAFDQLQDQPRLIDPSLSAQTLHSQASEWLSQPCENLIWCKLLIFRKMNMRCRILKIQQNDWPLSFFSPFFVKEQFSRVKQFFFFFIIWALRWNEQEGRGYQLETKCIF